jgi:hypothetical protein
MKKLAIALSLVFALVGCGGGGGSSPTVQSDPAFHAEYISSCEVNSGNLQRIGDYTFTTNPWGKSNITNFTNCVVANSTVSGVAGRINWDWPNDGQFTVKAYPEVMYRPNGQPPNILLSELGNLTANFDISVSATGQYNVSFDMWIDSTKQADHWPHKAEVMIKTVHTWSDNNIVDTVTIDGVVYDFSVQTINIQGSWSMYSFQTRSPLYRGSLKIKSFMDYLVSRNYLLSTDVMSTLEFGSEIVQGTGQTTINSYSITK